MLKKIMLGALLVGLIGVLIAGAVVRTNAKAGEGTANESGGRGRTAEAGATEAGNGGQYSGRWAQDGLAESISGGQSSDTLSGVPQADVQPAEWNSIEGTVVSVADDLVEIQTATGEVIPFEGRPLSFALEQGFSLKVEDVVALAGFDEGGEFKIGRVTNLGSGVSITLRDTSGRPGWAGRGPRS